MGAVLVTGATGMVGRAYRRVRDHSLPHVWLGHRGSLGTTLGSREEFHAVDLERPGAAAEVVLRSRPSAVLHVAALSALGVCEKEPARAQRVNVALTLELARAAEEMGAHFVFLSTDQVFDGRFPPYDESAPVRPTSVYGRTKAEAEALALAEASRSTVLRVALVLSPSPSGRTGALDMLRPGPEGPARAGLFTDEWRTPIGGPCLGRLLRSVLEAGPQGLLHAGGPDRLDRFTLGQRIAAEFGWDPSGLRPALRGEGTPPRPADVSLDTTRLRSRAVLVAPRPLPAVLEELRALEARH